LHGDHHPTTAKIVRRVYVPFDILLCFARPAKVRPDFCKQQEIRRWEVRGFAYSTKVIQFYSSMLELNGRIE
jgi:hypothetical protein